MYKIYIETFSKNLRYYMKTQNKTRNDISNATGIPYTSIRDYEKGVCFAKRDKAEKIAEYFNIPLSKLIEYHSETEIMYAIDKSENNKLILEIVSKLSKLTKEQLTLISDAIDNSEADKLILEVVAKLSKLTKEQQILISNTIDMIDSKK